MVERVFYVTRPGELLAHPPTHDVWFKRLPDYHEFYCEIMVGGEEDEVEAFVRDRVLNGFIEVP